MTKNIMIVGVGGQGTLLASRILGNTVINEGYDVKVSEVHGMSQRGGGVQAHLRLSDKPISSDLIPSGKADMILSMEPLESLRYLQWLNVDGVLVTDAKPFVNIPNYPDVEKLYDAIKVLPKAKIVEAENLAKEAGNSKAENMVLVGAALDFIPVKKETIINSVKERFASKDPKLVEINCTAIELGSKAN